MIFYDGIIFSLQQTGGISVLFRELFSRLDKKNYEYEVQLYGDDVYLPHKSRNIRPQFQERYRPCVVRPDITPRLFHSTYYRIPNRPICTVTTVHDFTYEYFVKGARRAVHTMQKKAAIRRADKVICVSNSTKNDLHKFVPDVPEDRVVVVSNGVSTDYRLLDDRQDSWKEYVIFVGSRKGYKNFGAVVKALSLMKDLCLICVGGDSFNKEEIALVNSLLPNRCRHLGAVTNEHLNYLYNNAGCLVYPSMYEGFGIPVIEAMSAGCPVIAVNRSSIPEVAGNSAFLMEHGDVDEIRGALELVLTSSERAKLVQAGLKRSKMFSWEKTFDETLRVYEDVAGDLTSIVDMTSHKGI